MPDSLPAHAGLEAGAQAVRRGRPGRPPAARPDGSPRSYVVPCTSAFRDEVLAIAAAKGVSPADLARAVILHFPRETVVGAADPGGPAGSDRERVVLKGGASPGRVLNRKPRLQLRLPGGHTVGELRRALGLAVALARGARTLHLGAAGEAAPAGRIAALEEELARLRETVLALAFQPLAAGVASRADALHVLGFHPHARPEQAEIKARYRRLARIFHPDSPLGDNRRMGQLNAALEKLTI